MTLEEAVEAIDRALVAGCKYRDSNKQLAIPKEIVPSGLTANIAEIYSARGWDVNFRTERGYPSDVYEQKMGVSYPSMCNTSPESKRQYAGGKDERIFRSFLYFSPKDKVPVEY